MESRQLSELQPHPLNPRGTLVTDAAMEELAASIKSVGLLQPLIITPSNVVIAGHRRLHAAKIAGLLEVAVIVRDVSEVEQISLMLVENIQRKSLNPAEEGLAYLYLIDRGLTTAEIGRALGVYESFIKPRVAIAKLPPEARSAFAQGALPPYSVECLKDIEPKEQVRWCQRAVAGRWTGSTFQAAVLRSKLRGKSNVEVPEEGSRLKHISSAIRQLYNITDSLEEHSAPRAALLKLADGIRELEREVKDSRPRLRDATELRVKSSLLN